MKFIEDEDKKFWITTLKKGFVVAGVTVVSVWATMEITLALKPALVAGLTYIFAEATKYYNIQPNKTIKKNTYSFLI